MPFALTEQSIAELVVAEALLRDGRGLIRRGAYRSLGRTEDGGVVFADCQGTDPTPYRVVLDLATADRPLAWCSCPSPRVPCKHAVGLMLAFAAKGRHFGVGDAPAEILAAHKRLVERASRPPTAPRPRVVNRAALARKAQEQCEALEALETFVVDLATRGLGALDPMGIAAIDAHAARMSDADLGGPRYLLLRLAAVVRSACGATGEGDGHAVLGFVGGMEPEVRRAVVAEAVMQLWTTARRGRRALSDWFARGADPAAPDALAESLLGRRWQLDQLRDAGCWTRERTFIELAHERVDDPIGETVLTTGWLLDLDDGAVCFERSILPYKALHTAEGRHRVSRGTVLRVTEAALYPGEGLNRRIRWSDRDPVLTERAIDAEDLRQVHRHARTIDTVLGPFREHLASPLTRHEDVVLLAAAAFGQIGSRVVMEDHGGRRLAFADPPEASHATTSNLRRAAAAWGPGSVVVRLWYDHGARGVYAQALALIAGAQHVRLGL